MSMKLGGRMWQWGPGRTQLIQELFLFPFNSEFCNIFIVFSENKSWIYMKSDIYGTDIHVCVQFGPDPSRNLDLVNFNVVS